MILSARTELPRLRIQGSAAGALAAAILALGALQAQQPATGGTGAAVLGAAQGQASVGPPLPGSGEPSGELVLTDKEGTPLGQVLKRIYLSVSERFRPEYTQNFSDFNTATDDEFGFISSRLRLGLGADFFDAAGIFVEAQNNSFWGDESAFSNLDTSGEDDLKVYQAYLRARRIADSPFGIQVGRQELVYGTEMLLGDAHFGPGLSHDALKLLFEHDFVDVHAWYAKEVDPNVSVIPPATAVDLGDEDVDLWGLYSMLKCPQKSGLEGSGLDVYYLFLNDKREGLEDERHTLGFRLYAALLKFLHLSGEFAWQFGDSGPARNDIRAFGVETEATVFFNDVLFKPKGSVGYSFASGDPDPTDSRNETFHPLFQDNHPRLGLSDLLFLENLHALSLKGSFFPFDKIEVPYFPVQRIEVGAGFYAFWVNHTQDSAAPTNLVASGGVGGSNFVGNEFDIYANLRITRYINAQLAWAHFFPGRYIRSQFAERDDADRLYIHLVAGF